ncbi:GDSL-type esterase/lipase family protein [Campylobacterota bacterium DY0563]
MINYKYLIFFIIFTTGLFANTQPKIYFEEYKTKEELLKKLPDNHSYKIAMLGDSITAAAKWKSLLGRNDVLNLGVASDVTDVQINGDSYGLINRIENLDKKFDDVFLMIGVNDFLFQRDVSNVFEKYKNIIEKLEKKGIKPIIQSTLFIRKNNYGFSAEEMNEKIKQLDILLRIYCEKNNLKYLNLNKYLSQNNTLINEYTWDGIHLNQKGYEIWADIIKKKI